MSKLRSIIRPLVFRITRTYFLHQRCKPNHRQRSLPKCSFKASIGFLSWYFASNADTFPNHFDAEKQISQLITQAEECIIKDKVVDAKKILQNALKVADENQAYGSLSYLCDLLSSIVLSEGELFEAEDILVKSIEKLQQLGYSETHNSIVKFKLKLARLYQMLGSEEMAEYGFRDCISVQEKKLISEKQFDEDTNLIYLTALFWYAKLLVTQKEYIKAKSTYKKCLSRIFLSSGILPSQKMVVLHNIAGVSAILKDYDAALNYLFDAIEICLVDDPNNPDLPIYVVQVGLMYLQKGIYEGASFWCQTGASLAAHERNTLAEAEGKKCVDELKRLKILK